MKAAIVFLLPVLLLSQQQTTVGTYTLNLSIPNSPAGTFLNRLAKISGSPAQGSTAQTTDTKAVGIVTSGNGTSGNAQIAVLGSALCAFDGPTVAGDYFTLSPSVAGDCHDAGAACPTTTQGMGLAMTTHGAAGTWTVQVIPNICSLVGTVQAPTFIVDSVVDSQACSAVRFSGGVTLTCNAADGSVVGTTTIAVVQNTPNRVVYAWAGQSSVFCVFALNADLGNPVQSNIGGPGDGGPVTLPPGGVGYACADGTPGYAPVFGIIN